MSYDVLIYHLAVPKIWLEAGSIFPVPGNFYSHQPFMAEMNFLLSLALGAGGLKSIPIALNLFGWLGVIAMGHTLARTMGAGRMFSLIAAATLGGMPLIINLAADARVDIWVVLGVQIIVYAWMQWLRRRDIASVRLAGLALGFLITVKHPAAAFWGVPLIAMMGLTLLQHRAPWNDWKRALAWGTPLALLAVLPWWIKEFAWSGNPIFPLGYSVFGGEGWSQVQADKLVAGHGLRLPFSTAYWSDVFLRLEKLGGWEGKTDSLIAIAGTVVLAVVFTLKRRRRIGATAPLITAVFGLFAWNLLSGGPDRFAAPALGLLIPLAVAFDSVFLAFLRKRYGRWQRAWGVLFVVLPLLAVVQLGRVSTALIPFMANHQNLTPRVLGLPHMEAHQRLNWEHRDSPEMKVLLIGEARTIHLDPPAVFGTVYDGQPLREFVRGASSVEEVFDRLRADGITHVMLNGFELQRLMRLYFEDPETGPFEFERQRPLWDFPSPLTDQEHTLLIDTLRSLLRDSFGVVNGQLHIAHMPE